MGRDQELEELDKLLQENNQVLTERSRSVAIAAILGMGGLGKTELALQYAMTQRENYKGGLCWLQAKVEDFGVQVVRFARTQLDLKPPEEFDLPAQVQYCWRYWREGNVLLVVDDVTDYQQIRPYLQGASSRFKVLMTTRKKLGAAIKQLPLDVLQPDAALELLRSLLAETPGRIERELDVAKQLCEWLGYLPLGLELVGRYLARKPDLSLSKMMGRLKEKRLEQPATVNPEADMTAQRGIKAAFELSWQELAEDDKLLGCVLSLFATAPIPWNLVEQCLTDKDEDELEEIRDDKLLNLHLLQRKGEGIYQLHPLLREFFQSKFTGLEQVEEFRRSFCQVMVAVAKQIPQTPTLEKINAVSLAIPHIAEVANHLIQYISDEDFIKPFIGLGDFYQGQGLYTQAEPWNQQCLSTVQNRLGDNHPDVATSLNNLAYLYYSQGKYDQAEPLYLQALELRQRLLGDNHPHVATSLNNLAYLYYSQGKYDQAEPLYLQALELSKRLLGDNHPHVAISLNSLANLYYSQGKYGQAEPLYLQALELDKRLLGDNHPHVAISLNNLAYLYNSQGKYGQAEPLYLQALELSKRLLGDNHPHVAISLNNLALLYNSQGKYDQAEPLYLQALELSKRLLGDNHPHVATSLNNLALLYNSQGRYDQAEPLYLQALELSKRLLGDNHPHVATSLNNLAYLYNSQGKYDQAEPLYLQALELRQRLLGDNHPHVAQSLNNLAGLYKSQGKYDQAEPLLLQALELSKRLLGDNHPDVAQSLNNLAGLYKSQGKYDQAEPLLLQALELSKRLLGDNHPDVATSFNNLAYLYYSQGKYNQTEPLLLQALDILERSLGANHPNTVTLRENLAILRDHL
ncbi:tetratricopeptide repeat protein [Nostoc sp. UHCC 0870]|uniref:tetratricopeptide repeat protein n=1 Tax=Nostoc sp. UHCC 0870 TaxID=2914041 RepID=UPI001EE083B6|nr:tetratricopeptide repeat protein [Nostoc sp. UHCC 0870]UKO97522.1 tetratricopeptide repeat protein [Nostoc sp. UHCC 0870]